MKAKKGALKKENRPWLQPKNGAGRGGEKGLVKKKKHFS